MAKNLNKTMPKSESLTFKQAQEEMFRKKPTIGTFTYSVGKSKVQDVKPFTLVGSEIKNPEIEKRRQEAEELIELGSKARAAGLELDTDSNSIVIPDESLASLFENERAVFKEILLLSTELATQKALLTQLYKSPFLSPDDKDSLLGHTELLLTSLDKKIVENTDTPNMESVNAGKEDLAILKEKVAVYTKLEESLRMTTTLREETEISQLSDDKPSPVDEVFRVATARASSPSPDTQPEPAELSPLQRDILDTHPKNIFQEEKIWYIRHADGSNEKIRGGKDLSKWFNTRSLLKRYADFVGKRKPETIHELALLKDNFLNAIESEDWEKGAEAYDALESALQEAKRNYIAKATSAPLTSSTVTTSEPALATEHEEEEPATAPAAPPLPPRPPTPPHTVDPPKEPGPSPKPKNVELAPSTSEKKPLDIWSTWPSYIYFEKGKDPGNWVFALDGKKQYLPNTSEWSTEEANLKPVLLAYTQFLRGTSSLEQAAKIEACTSLIEAKNAVIQALKEKDIVKAGVCREILAQELNEWQLKWPLLIEQEKLTQVFESRKKAYLQEISRSGNLQKELTSTLEKEHIEREQISLDTLFKKVENTANNNTLTSKDLELLQNATVRFTSLLNTYDEKLTKVMTPSLGKQRVSELYKKRGVVLRSTVATSSNKNQAVSRIGKPNTTVGKWQEEQDTALKEKEQITSMTEVQNIQDMMERHKIMYDRDPKKYIATYRYKIFDRNDPERAIVREIMKDTKDVLTPQEILRLDKEYFAQQSKVSSIQTISSSYSPEKEAEEQAKDPRITEALKKQEDERKTEDKDGKEKIFTERSSKVPLKDAVYNGGMTTPETVSRQPMAITTPEKKSPEIKLQKVSKLLETRTLSKKITWLALASALFVTEPYPVEPADVTTHLEKPFQKDSKNWEYYLQTKDSQEMKKNLSLSSEELIKRYIPSSDSLFATSLLKASASIIFHDNGNDVVEGVTDQKGINHRKEISAFLLLLQEVSQATTAPLRAEAVKNNKVYSLDATDMIPKNSLITIGEYITEVKRKVGDANKREGK